MSKRPRPVLPITGRKPVLETKPVGDKAKLMFAQVSGPLDAAMNAVVNARNAAFQTVAAAMLEWDGLDADAGWKFNVDTLKYERHPVQKPGA